MKRKTINKKGIIIWVIVYTIVFLWLSCFVIMFKGIDDGIISYSDDFGWYDRTVYYTNLTDGTTEYTYTNLGLLEVVDQVISKD